MFLCLAESGDELRVILPTVLGISESVWVLVCVICFLNVYVSTSCVKTRTGDQLEAYRRT